MGMKRFWQTAIVAMEMSQVHDAKCVLSDAGDDLRGRRICISHTPDNG